MIQNLELFKTPLSTGIGSLPHHNIDSALNFSFQCDIPFLPQIPIRNSWEFMIPQALEGLPGLEVENDGGSFLDTDVWSGLSKSFNEKLLNAFSESARRSAFAAFEPTAATFSSWQPFIWELQEQKVKTAKIQLAGPITCQTSLKSKDGSSITDDQEILTQIYRIVLARCIAMSRRLIDAGVAPLFFLDEPALFSIRPSNHLWPVAMQELKLTIESLKKERVLVGLHCCCNTDWDAVFSLGLNVLSIDVEASLSQILASKKFDTFIKDGGKLSLGVIPTSKRVCHNRVETNELIRLSPEELFCTLIEKFSGKTELVKRILSEAIYTPACGLALHTTSEAEAALANLGEFVKFVRKTV